MHAGAGCERWSLGSAKNQSNTLFSYRYWEHIYRRCLAVRNLQAEGFVRLMRRVQGCCLLRAAQAGSGFESAERWTPFVGYSPTAWQRCEASAMMAAPPARVLYQPRGNGGRGCGTQLAASVQDARE